MLIRKIRTKKFSTKLANKINWANQYINCVTIEYIQTCHRETIQLFDQFTELVFSSLIYFFVSSFLRYHHNHHHHFKSMSECTWKLHSQLLILCVHSFEWAIHARRSFFYLQKFFSLFQSIVTTTTCVHYCERQRFSVFFSSHFLNEDEQIFPS